MSDAPTPMARAVEAAQKIPPRAREGCRCTHGPDEEDAGLCPPCYMCPECDAAWHDAMLRAALPALLEAVVGKMQGGDDNVRLFSTEDDPVRVSRAELLAALTTAAGRLS